MWTQVLSEKIWFFFSRPCLPQEGQWNSELPFFQPAPLLQEMILYHLKSRINKKKVEEEEEKTKENKNKNKNNKTAKYNLRLFLIVT